MHQHPRSPASAAPTFPARLNPTRSEDQRDLGPNSPTLDTRINTSRGLGIETGTEPGEQSQRNTPPAKEAMAKLNQIISNYHTKAALIILHSRVELPPSFSKGSDTPKVNRWFNVEVEDTDVLREQLRTWRTCDATDNRPPPLIIETYLDAKGLTNNQSLVILDENGKRWDVLESLAASREAQSTPTQSGPTDIILERWTVELGDTSSKPPADLGSILPTVYKKSIVLFRSLCTYSKFLPAWKFAKRNGKRRSNPALQIRYRIVEGRPANTSKPDHLTLPLYESNSKAADTYSFGVTESPAGPFSVQVTYRTSCDFRVDDSEALLSSRFMGADDEIFRPSIPSGDFHEPPNPEIGSVPLARRTVENPDPSRAYGSLSTFHHVGPATGTSPISALRAARESGATSPSPTSSPRKPIPTAKASPVGRAAALAGEAAPGIARRSSISFQPFKAPPLSASPSLFDAPLGVSPRSGAARTPSSESKNMPPPSFAASARKPMSSAPENAIASSNSASPRPAPISRYSSAFSHRRNRPSSGGMNKIEDDTSSGKASAASSAAQPGSGLLAEPTGTSADSIHADDENISEFLKMLDLRKDLMNPTNSTSLETTSRKTTTSAALSRFQRMRDSNAALSDSMSSSLLMHRSSNSSSKQLSGVPPMVAGTSISTASSPGKPISPHTPHTPAIPSRLSSNSIAQYTEPEEPPDETPDDQDIGGPTPSNAIDIPISPRIFAQPYRRPSSAVQRPRPLTTDEDDEIFPFGMRSISLGAEDRGNTSLSALQRQQDIEATGNNANQTQRPPSVNDEPAAPSDSTSDPYRAVGSRRGRMTSGQAAASSSSNHHVYQPRFSSSRGRGFSGGHSLSSGSSSLARGTNIPPHLAERDHDRDGQGSGSNSGHSTVEARRGSGQRSSFGRSYPPQTTPHEDDEPLLFAMSDFSASRRSLEERQGTHGADSGVPSASRRNSGRRLPSFQPWT